MLLILITISICTSVDVTLEKFEIISLDNDVIINAGPSDHHYLIITDSIIKSTRFLAQLSYIINFTISDTKTPNFTYWPRDLEPLKLEHNWDKYISREVNVVTVGITNNSDSANAIMDASPNIDEIFPTSTKIEAIDCEKGKHIDDNVKYSAQNWECAEINYAGKPLVIYNIFLFYPRPKVRTRS